MTRKSHQKFWPENGNFSEKSHSEILFCEKLFPPPKLGARSPPLIASRRFLLLSD